MKKIFLLLSVTGILFITPNQAKADVIYNTFGPGDSYNTGTGWTVNNSFEPASAFTPTANYNLTSVSAALSLFNGAGTNSVELLLTNSVNNQPGSTLESFLFTNQMGTFGLNNPPLSANSVSNPELLAGDQYWLIAEYSDPSSLAVWNWSSTNGPTLDSENGGSTWQSLGNPQGAFEINGTLAGASPVPEPASLFLFAIGIAGILLRRQLIARF